MNEKFTKNINMRDSPPNPQQGNISLHPERVSNHNVLNDFPEVDSTPNTGGAGAVSFAASRCFPAMSIRRAVLSAEKKKPGHAEKPRAPAGKR